MCLVDRTVRPAERRPVVDRRGLHRAQRGRNYLEVRVRLRRLADHLPIALQIQRLEILVVALDGEAEARCEILLIADHDVHISCDLPVDLLAFFDAPDRAPHGRPVIEVIGNHGAIFLGCPDSLQYRFAGLLGQCRVDSAGMQPPHSQLSEDIVKIKILRFCLRYRRVGAVRAAHRAADAEPPLREIESIAADAPDSIRLCPVNKRGVHASLTDEILHKLADLIVSERRDNRGLHAKAFAKPPDYIVFPAAFPGAELACCPDPSFSRIETEHDFSERDSVVCAFLFCLQLQIHKNLHSAALYRTAQIHFLVSVTL